MKPIMRPTFWALEPSDLMTSLRLATLVGGVVRRLQCQTAGYIGLQYAVTALAEKKLNEESTV